MNDLFSSIYLLLFFLSLIGIFCIYKSIIQPITILAVTFTLFPFIVTLHPLGLYELSLETHLYILLAYSVFAGGVLTFSKAFGIKRFSKNQTVNNNCNYVLLIILNLAVLIYLIPHFTTSLNVIMTQGWSYLRFFADKTYSESTSDNIIYSWFIKSLVIASVAILSFDLFNHRSRWQIPATAIVIINVLFDVVIYAARATIVKVIIYLALSFLFCKTKKYSKTQIALVILLGAFLVAVVAVVTGERMAGFSPFESVAIYYCAPFSLFDYYVRNPGFSQLGPEGIQYGAATFGFAYNTIRSILYVAFGLPYNGSDFIITQVTSQAVKVGESVTINAGCTATYFFMRDFGVFGIIIGYLLMAALITLVQRAFQRQPSTRTGAFYIVVLYIIFRLSSSYDLMSPSLLFSALFIFVLTWRPAASKQRKGVNYEAIARP